MRLVVQTAALLGIGIAAGLVDMTARPLPTSQGNTNTPEDLLGSDPQATTPDDPTGPEGVTPADPVTPAPEAPTNPPEVVDPAPTPVVTPAAPRVEFPTRTPGANWPSHHITVEQASRFFGRPDVFFVDARSLDKFEAGHTQGAICLPLEAFHGQEPAILDFFRPADMPIVIVYCGGGDCEESDAVRDMLKPNGYDNVFVMHDGWPGWEAAGLPTETGRGEWADFYDW